MRMRIIIFQNKILIFERKQVFYWGVITPVSTQWSFIGISFIVKTGKNSNCLLHVIDSKKQGVGKSTEF